MADEEQVKLLKSGLEAWNEWREANRSAGINLQAARLRKEDLSHRKLDKADLRSADLREVDFRRARLRGAKLGEAVVRSASFRNADLRDADLASVEGLREGQLAGALTSQAKLPEAVARFDALKVVEKASGYARKIFLAMLLGCAYAILTIATTTDARLLTNSATSPLPIIQSQIPIVGFYFVAPLILLGFYLYFHLCMQKIWERLATLPAELPDGRKLDTAADPWLLLGLVRSHFGRLRDDRTFSDLLQAGVSIVLAWWSVPVTLLLLWGRYLRRHEVWGTSWQIALLMGAVAVGIYFYRRAVRALRGEGRGPFSLSKSLRAWRGYAAGASATAAVGLLCSLLSLAAIQDWRWDMQRPRTSVGGVSLVALRDWLLTADIANAELSTRPDNWTGGVGEDANQIQLVRPAELIQANLRRARAWGAFLVKADLRGADLSKADLNGADLRQAYLWGATLANADLEDADLTGAELSMADLREVENLDQEQLDSACIWELLVLNLPEGLKQPPACPEQEAGL